MKLHRLPLFTAAAFAALAQLNAQTTVATDPVGFTTVSIAAGTGSSKKNTFFSLPLLETPDSLGGQVSGVITGVGTSTLTNSSAGWTAGGLSQAATPYVIMITSGTATGRMFLVGANTTDTVTISANDITQTPNLTTLGIAAGTDTYKIYACDTLASFFGTPASSGVIGGTSVNSADTIVFNVNGALTTYYYNTSLGRWTKSAFGNPSGANTAILPYYGMQYQRIGNTSLSFVTTGNVPTVARKVQIKNSGNTFLSQYWPANSTLSSLGLQNMPSWTSGNATTGDNVTVTSGGASSLYYYDGTNWRKSAFGSPISNTNVIPVGSAVQITKKGSASGYTTLAQTLPYSL